MIGIALEDGLELQLFHSDHAEALFALTVANREHLRVWLPWVDDITILDDSLDFIRYTRRAYTNMTGMHFAIVAAGQLCGAIGFNFIDQGAAKAEIGYWLAADAQGQGIMTRSVAALSTYGFAKLGLNTIEIACAQGNHRSRAIPLRLGFQHDRVREDAEWLHDRYVNWDIFVMQRHNWKERP